VIFVIFVIFVARCRRPFQSNWVAVGRFSQAA